MKYWIFDFNGTIIDDVDVCIYCENKTIKKYLNRPPLSKEEYLDIFTFPVEEYYKKVGFDFSDYTYEEIGAYWFKNYCENKHRYKLHDGVIEILKRNKDNGDKNVVLSASSLVELTKQLEELNIKDYFDYILGIDNIYASSKLPIALKFMKDKNPEDCLMIGDTIHDLEVAKAMGIRCILVAKGHQSKKKLVEKSDNVVDDIREIEW